MRGKLAHLMDNRMVRNLLHPPSRQLYNTPMKRKASVKKPVAVSVKLKKKATTRGEEPATTRFREYLGAKFTGRLIEHMHRAKRAALKKNG
jgi:hypothetical protein